MPVVLVNYGDVPFLIRKLRHELIGGMVSPLPLP